MTPSRVKYNVDNIDPNTTFKKTITDLRKIRNDERDESFKREFDTLLRKKAEDSDRYAARKLERLI